MIDREHCRVASDHLREDRDCTVRACACATQIDYAAMRDYLAAYGRKPRQGMMPVQYLAALRDLGCTLTELSGPKYEHGLAWVNGDYRGGFYKSTRRKVANGRDYSSATVRSLQKELTSGTYLVITDGHVLCLRDGIAEDFTSGRLHRIERVYKVDL